MLIFWSLTLLCNQLRCNLLNIVIKDSWDGAEEEEEDIIAVDANTWRVRGTTPLKDVEEALDMDLPDEDYDTFGGLIFDELGMIPEEGSNFPPMELYGLQVKIERIEARRILWTLVCKLNPPAELNIHILQMLS